MVKQIKKIMVPLAFSSFSRDMVEFAAQLARPFEAELILVNVINERDVEAVQRITSFGYEVNEEDYVRAIEKQRVEKVEAMVREIDFPEEKIHMIFKVGRPASTLLKVALREEVDMIVMGIKAKTDLVHAFTGSVAEKLFRRSPITIVSYRDENNARRLRKRLEA